MKNKATLLDIFMYSPCTPAPMPTPRREESSPAPAENQMASKPAVEAEPASEDAEAVLINDDVRHLHHI